MALLSKLLGAEWSFGYNCYEVGHTWTPSCTDASLEVASSAAASVLPLYAALYGFSQLAVQRRLDSEAWLETAASVLRSSAFIFFHAYNGSLLGCFLRHSLGRFYYRVLVWLPALLSSYLALAIEKPARRQALAFYMLNLASEVLFRMAVARGLFRPPKRAETLLFALSLAVWYRHIRLRGFGRDPLSAGLRALVGAHEGPTRAAPEADADQPPEAAGRHRCCPHRGSSCARYVLEPLPARFLLGYLGQAALSAAARPRLLLSAPLAGLGRALTAWDSLRAGAFLASLVGVGRLSSCLLRRLSDAPATGSRAACAGFAAGLSMAWLPRAQLSMYVMWKALEQSYLGARPQHAQLVAMSVYACSAAAILYAFALEPRFVRPSYMKFLDRLSEHRLHQLNRLVLDVFQTGASVGYEDYFPDLHPRFMSNQFQELVFNWLIQPHE